jgi:hypothetical protein
LYPFTTDKKGITTEVLGQKVKFKFFQKTHAKDINMLQEVSVFKTINILQNKNKHLNFLKEEIKSKRIEEKLSSEILLQNKSS